MIDRERDKKTARKKDFTKAVKKEWMNKLSKW